MSDVNIRAHKAKTEAMVPLAQFLEVKQNLINHLREIADRQDIDHNWFVNWALDQTSLSEEAEEDEDSGDDDTSAD